MKVAIVCNEYPPCPHGGIGSAARDLAVGLAARGAAVEIVGVYSREDLERFDLPSRGTVDDIAVTRLPCRGRRLPFSVNLRVDRLQLLEWLWRRHRQQAFDIVFSEDYQGLLPWGGPPGARSVIRLNGSTLVYDSLLQRGGTPLLWQMERRTLRNTDAWIGVSDFFLGETRRLIAPSVRQRLTVIPNPVDTDLFSPSADADRTPSYLGRCAVTGR